MFTGIIEELGTVTTFERHVFEHAKESGVEIAAPLKNTLPTIVL